MSMTPLADAVATILALIARRRRARAKAAAGETIGAMGPWDAMVLREAGPARSEPIRPVRRVRP